MSQGMCNSGVSRMQTFVNKKNEIYNKNTSQKGIILNYWSEYKIMYKSSPPSNWEKYL